MINSEKMIIRKLIRKIEIESFLTEILDSINYSLNANDVELIISKNDMTIKTKYNTIDIRIIGNTIIYIEENKNSKTTKEYVNIPTGYIVKIKIEKQDSYDLDDKVSIDKKTTNEFRYYNLDRKEITKAVETNVENYLQDKVTKKITLHNPDEMENYIEKKYYYRIEDKYIIERSIKKYAYRDGTEDFIPLKNSDNVYIRYKKINPDVNDIPTTGDFYEIDSDVFFQYNQNKATMDDIIENFKSKKYHIPKSIWI